MTATANTITVNMPRLYPKQLRAIFAPQRYSMIEASTKAGKTLGCLVWQATQALRDKKKMNHWWVAPVYPQSRIAYERAKKMLPRELYSKNDTDLRLSLVNGSTWWFKSGEKPDNLYGEDVASAVIDEASRLREEAWHAVRSTLTATKGPVRIIGNVKGRRNWAYQLARKAEGGEKDMSYHKLTAFDAIEGGIVTQEEIDDAKRMLPDAVFRELYLAEPTDDGGNPFGMKAIRECVGSLSSGKPVAFGVDLAKSQDWTVVVGLDEAGSVCTLERWQSDWGATRSRILALVNGWPTLVDSTGVGDPIVEDLQRVRPNIEGFKFSQSSKQQLMEGLASAIQQQAVKYPDGWLVKELESFEYEYTRTGVRYSAPEGLHDDGVCALALAWQKHRGTQGGGFWFSVSGGEKAKRRDDW